MSKLTYTSIFDAITEDKDEAADLQAKADLMLAMRSRPVKTLYRYEAMRYSVVIDAEMDLFGVSTARLELQKYNVVAETPKGYWITFASGGKDKWVSNISRKRYAHPTKDEAREAYRQRKLAFVHHAETRLKRAKEDLSLINRMEGKL